MKFLFDLFPVILFFVAFKYGEVQRETAAAALNTLAISLGFPGGFDLTQAPLLLATVVVIIATFMQIAWVKWRHGKVDTMLWISLALIVTLGGMTLYFHDERFIKWKPTALYWAFAVTLLAAQGLFGSNLLKKYMADKIHLPDDLWARVNLSWAAFFVVMGALNLWVAFSFTTETWVNFKLFGSIGCMVLFVAAQSIWLARKVMPQGLR